MNDIAKSVILLASAGFLAGCATTKQVEVVTTPTKYQIYQPAPPAAVKLNKIKFRVVTKETLDAFVAEESKKQGNPNPVFVVMSTKDYQAISLNLAELKRYIDQQKQIIVYYEKATDSK